jgi:hypothetical protein
MWILQNGHLMSLPDDAPLPPNSTKTTLPPDFFNNAGAYKVESSSLVKRPAKELRAAQAKRVPPLTDEEILGLRKLLQRAGPKGA